MIIFTIDDVMIFNFQNLMYENNVSINQSRTLVLKKIIINF